MRNQSQANIRLTLKKKKKMFILFPRRGIAGLGFYLALLTGERMYYIFVFSVCIFSYVSWKGRIFICNMFEFPHNSKE